MEFHVFVYIAILLVGTGINAASYWPEVILDNRCNQTIDLPASGKAGSLVFPILPRDFCKVRVVLDTFSWYYYSWTETFPRYSIYLNIRKSNMPTNSLMEIYDTSGRTRTLGKSWGGGVQSQHFNPTSAGQYLSHYDEQPEISIEFTPSSSYPPGAPHQVFFDYVIVEESAENHNSYCGALGGYVYDDLICDQYNDRVNCPENYNNSIYDMDPALERHHRCDLMVDTSGCPGPEWFARPGSSDCYYAFAALDTGATSGPLSTQITFAEAVEECNYRGGKLFAPKDKTELEFVMNKLTSAEDHYWIGLTYQSGQWRWLDDNGTPGAIFNPSLFPPYDFGWFRPNELSRPATEFRGTIRFVDFDDMFYLDAVLKNQTNGFICSGSFSRQQPCRVNDGWIYDDQACYQYIPEPSNYPDAQSQCRSKGGSVSGTNTVREDKRIKEWIRNRLRNTVAWLGITIPNKTSAVNARNVYFDDGQLLANTSTDHWNLEGKTLEQYIAGLANGRTYCGEIYSIVERPSSWSSGVDQHDYYLRPYCDFSFPYACEAQTITNNVVPAVYPDIECYSPFTRFHDGCYYFVEGRRNRDEAQRFCKSYRYEGAYLYTPMSIGQNIYIRGRIEEEIWLGIKAASLNEDHEWIQEYGDETVFTSLKNYHNYADHASWPSAETDQLCTIMDYNCTDCSYIDRAKWNFASCTEKKQFFCYHDGRPKNDPGPTPTSIYHPGCPTGWRRNGDSCYKEFLEGTTWRAAKSNCRNLDDKSDLVSVFTEDEERYIRELVRGHGSDTTFWINFYSNRLNVWFWQTQNETDIYALPAAIFNWAAGEPDNSHPNWQSILAPISDTNARCAYIQAADGKWADHGCGTNRAYICKRPSYDAVTTSPIQTPSQFSCRADSYAVGSKCLNRIFELSTWTAAQNSCQSTGGHLASFSNEAEYRSVAAFTSNEVWIGLNSLDSPRDPKVFSWSDGSATGYLPWRNPPFPISFLDITAKDCVTSSGELGLAAISCDSEMRAVCESALYETFVGWTPITIPLEDGCEPWGHRVGSSCFYFGHDPNHSSAFRPYHTFDDARNFCRKTYENADLATIVDSEEEALIDNKIRKYSGDYWIGLRESNRTLSLFQYWIDGTFVSLTNWASGQPQTSFIETRCVAMEGANTGSYRPGEWFTEFCASLKFPLCKAPARETWTPPTGSTTRQPPPTTTRVPVITTSTQRPITPTTGSSFEVPSYLTTPLKIGCRLGKLNFSENDLDLVDSLTTVFDGDNTLNCRLLLHDLHSWIVAKAGETRQKRASHYDPVTVECTRGNLTISSMEPGMSESTDLVFRTGASARCIKVYREFLTYVGSFYKM
ncbi:C-type mannose receptor 2-like [Paramacrobiotus metropolitanus]|uniref:C-type mannose receptor 2-like n=1 Tax=Paramacrobiotus metropolitanus TaxID=2943436 RepID=UPI00244582B7|nr:C-type mannose receptor 2-like [Paramacrobiotus metropolitanus]